MPCFVHIEFSPVILHVSFRLKRFCHFIHSFIYVVNHLSLQATCALSTMATHKHCHNFVQSMIFYFYFSFRSFSIMFLIHFFSRYCCCCWYFCAVPCASIHKFTWCFVMFGAFICLFIFNFYCEKQYKLRQKMGTKKESC